MTCDSCRRYVPLLERTYVEFNDGDRFRVCTKCARAAEGRVLETLNRIRFWRTGSLTAT
jgi:protein-arginine kinase activator protein McsA